MTDLMIKVEEEKANIFTPYNADFVKKIKGIGGARWNASKKCWSIPKEFVERCRNIMFDVYGKTDEVDCNKLKLRLTFLEDAWEERGDITMFGKILCHATSRDSGGYITDDDVALISGNIDSGGSAKYWGSSIDKGTVMELINVSEHLYKKYLENPDENVKVEVIEDKTDRDKLIEEKNKLLARLEEINKLLGE
jgi:hypothetical protein